MDIRVSKTQKSLADAANLLMEKYAWRDISVSTLCDQAGISRSTFYAHFATKAELLEQMFLWVEQDLIANAPENRGLDVSGQFGFLPGLIAILRARRQIFRRQQHNESGIAMAHRTRQMIANMMLEETRNSTLSNQLSDRDLIFLGGAVSAVIRKWADDKHVEADEELINSLDNHVTGFFALLEGRTV
ncbi:transcriptional regulator, TetR family [Parasphingorhabdus marina DSM 22363]|uniref:Transcriptional regulator, TetR family n=1 Tax=Parasphingorhabdus marina DSM 22363 TaxID=1123272 RepID=A0A1N6CQK4_9SPHN|nr:TetR/AcrR family transcriptional regulator [Parasphingorhabdus marina]SIN60861.1 transcriptional regulator, TetR family [Parasphingorhabdus marina DSM 22363]